MLPFSEQKYASAINGILKNILSGSDPFVLFGQNVSAGSCLSGLTRGLQSSPDSGLEMFNTPNCENAMVGFGFGMMMRGVNSAFFVKQHDFLLLTIDHMVNTYNMIKLQECKAGFTIVCIVVDSGFEGPQSRLNNLGEFSSIADFPTYGISTQQEAESILPLLKEPGFRIIALSQRLFRDCMLEPTLSREGKDKIFCYSSQTETENTESETIKSEQKELDFTIASFNFSLPQSIELQNAAKQKNYDSEIFSITNALPKDFSDILESVKRTKKLVVIDDSRSINRSSDRLRLAVYEQIPDCVTFVAQKQPSVEAIVPNIDDFRVDSHEILSHLNLNEK